MDGAPTAKDMVVLAANGVIMLVSIVASCRCAAGSGLVSQTMRALKTLRHTICVWKRRAVDDVAEEVEKRIQKEKVNYTRNLYRIICMLVIPRGLAHLLRCAMGQASEPLLQEVPALVVKGVCAATLLCPSIVCWRSIDALYVAVAASCSLVAAAPALIATNSPNEVVVTALPTVNILMIAQSIARRDLYIVAPANAAFTASVCIGVWAPGGVASRMFLITSQCVVMLFVSVFAHLLDEWSRAIVRAGLQVKAAKQLLSAARGLLRSCCDMVIEIDSVGAIIGHARDLGSFLLRGPDSSLQGRSLTELMVHEEDRRAFLTRMQVQPEEQDMADAMHVHMRDANNTTLHLQLLLFRYMHTDDTLRCMVGVRGDFPALGERALEPDAPQGPGEPQRPHAPGRGGPASPLPPSRSEEVSISVLPPAEDVVSELSESMPPVLVVDAREPGFPIRECSTGFRTRIGRLPPSACLRDIVEHDRAFMNWMHDTLNAIVDRMPLPDSCRLTLYMPDSQVTANCKVLSVEERSRSTRALGRPLASRDEEDPGSPLPGQEAFGRVELIFSRISRRRNSRFQPRWQFPAVPSMIMRL